MFWRKTWANPLIWNDWKPPLKKHDCATLQLLTPWIFPRFPTANKLGTSFTAHDGVPRVSAVPVSCQRLMTTTILKSNQEGREAKWHFINSYVVCMEDGKACSKANSRELKRAIYRGARDD